MFVITSIDPYALIEVQAMCLIKEMESFYAKKDSL